MNDKFTVEICSDLNYEEMVADISYNGNHLASITQENGINEILILGQSESGLVWKLPLNEFQRILESAKAMMNSYPPHRYRQGRRDV